MRKSTALLVSVFSIVLVLLLFSISCTPIGEAPVTEGDFFGALVYNTLADLPTPSADNIGQLFYVIEEEKFYYSNGVEYVHIDLIISINWLGELATVPASPQFNDAYYNSTEGVAYVWDGDSWEVLARDGVNAISLNESGTISPGQALVLQHNLGRDDLTFTGQFVKNGFIYDYSEYRELFSSFSTKHEKTTFFDFYSSGSSYAQTATTGINDNDMVVAYSWDDSTNSYVDLKIYAYNPVNDQWAQSGGTINLGQINNPVYASEPIAATTLNDGNFVVVHIDPYLSDYYFYYDIYTPGGSQVYSNTVYDADKQYTDTISVAALQNGNFVVAYDTNVIWNYGYFDIYYSYGGSVTTLNRLGYDVDYVDDISVTPLNNGNFVVVYNEGGGDYPQGWFDIYESNGNPVSQNNAINDGSDLDFMSVATLANGNFVVAFFDAGTSDGVFEIYNPSGNRITDPVTFHTGDEIYETSITSLSNGKFVIAYEYYDGVTFSYIGRYKVYDSTGNTVWYEGKFYDGDIEKIATTELRNGTFNILYVDAVDGYYDGYFNVYSEALIVLEKVDSNTVRLWNYTDETLEMMLSVDQ